MKSIYKNQCPQLKSIFDTAKSPQKVLCVAIDYAKLKHVALICDGNGNVMKKPFTVDNSLAGIAFLVDQINATARRRKIPRKQIFIGGEDSPSYVDNFAENLKNQNFLILRVNAKKAKEARENEIASSDQLALLGISKTLLSRRAEVYADPSDTQPDLTYLEIQDLSRSRDRLVRNNTALSNQIHTYVDRLFPSFLDGSKSGITPFSQASVGLMTDRFSCTKIAKKKQSSLAKKLRGYQVHHADETAHKLIELAQNSLTPNVQRMASQQASLKSAVELYQNGKNVTSALQIECAIVLATTPYAFLTTIPGIGFAIACGTAGELGDPAKLAKADSLCGYAGIAPGMDQTGGPDVAPVMKRTKRRCNRILKNWVCQASERMGQWGHSDWTNRYDQWNTNGQHALFCGARRYLRLVKMLTNNQTAYQSMAAREVGALKEVRRADAEATWQKLLPKWKVVPNYQQLVFAEDKPLGFWRILMMETFEADMHLPSPKRR